MKIGALLQCKTETTELKPPRRSMERFPLCGADLWVSRLLDLPLPACFRWVRKPNDSSGGTASDQVASRCGSPLPADRIRSRAWEPLPLRIKSDRNVGYCAA